VAGRGGGRERLLGGRHCGEFGRVGISELDFDLFVRGAQARIRWPMGWEEGNC
jgi:hypothetical protein